jgi:uncharacterized damage-inducible protein DinB
VSTEALLTAFATNNRIDEYLIRNLSDAAWRATPPQGKGRDIAAICAHMHNVRLMWLKSAGKTPELPAKLDGDTCTREETIAALGESYRALDAVIRESLETDGRIKGFKPDVWSFLAYLFAHEGHHRGQITMLARQTGHAPDKSVGFGLWQWGTR